MVFSSLVFLCVFLPIVLFVYRLCPEKYRNFLLLIASLVFYGWGEPRYLCIMLFSTVFDYINGRLVQYFQEKDRKREKKAVLLVSIVGNLGILCFFKYTDMFLQTWNQLTASHVNLLKMTLPIGISFYTFQTMSYTIDVYRGKVQAQRNIINFGMYVCLFPQLIAGPIVRYESIAHEINQRKVTEELWVSGMQRFLIGLGKKVILANQIGAVWDTLSSQGNALSVAGAWIGAIAYSFQIYFDFSGYSDMAIGLGKMFGFHFNENFSHPYEAENITEFWRKWHISLGSWFREYVYIPLGGNRKGLGRQIGNLFIVWFLTGLWHGASWNFAVWGIYFFVILLLEKVFLLREMERWPVVFRHIYAKILIITGWVIFAVEDFGKMGNYLKVMFGLQGELIDQTAWWQLRNYGVLFLILFVASTTIPKKLIGKFRSHVVKVETEFAVSKGKQVEFVLYSVYTVILLLISLGMLVGGTYNPFLYFRF